MWDESMEVCPSGTFAPDIDDRGFSVYSGPIVGVCCGDLTRIGLEKPQIYANAPLFVMSEDETKVAVVTPAPDAAKTDEERVSKIEFKAGNTPGDTKLRVHAQKKGGPIIAEITVHVSKLLTTLLAVHRTAIFKSPSVRAAANTTNRTFDSIDTLVTEVNRQWRPVGIEFTIDTRKDDTNLTNQVSRNGIDPVDGALLCPVYGSNESNENFSRLMATNRVERRLNIHFVSVIRTASADGKPFYCGFGSSYEKGLVVSDSTVDMVSQAQTIAHELGHIMNLAGIAHSVPEDAHSDDDPKWSKKVTDRRHDLWSRRRLMYYMAGLNKEDRIGKGGRYTFDGVDVGYGQQRVGYMITIKNLKNDATDNEYTNARDQQAKLFTP
jgi:hypothetical protein